MKLGTIRCTWPSINSSIKGHPLVLATESCFSLHLRSSIGKPWANDMQGNAGSTQGSLWNLEAGTSIYRFWAADLPGPVNIHKPLISFWIKNTHCPESSSQQTRVTASLQLNEGSLSKKGILWKLPSIVFLDFLRNPYQSQSSVPTSLTIFPTLVSSFSKFHQKILKKDEFFLEK